MFKFFGLFLDFLRDIYRNKFVIYQLTKRDYKNRYIGSFLGFIWTIIQPFVMILVLWLVFVKGFKAGDLPGEVPFIAYLSLGVIAWDLFSSVLMTSTNVFHEYSYLVKKINFRIAILPIVKLLSSFITHVIFICIGIVILLVSGVEVSWWWVQVVYYLFALMVLLLGLSWITSSLQVFVKDVVQVINVILQFGFWFTPIVWDFNLVPQHYEWFFRLNPMFYIVEGYRKSFIYGEPFWGDLEFALYYWVVTLAILLVGVLLFKRLRPHFADVL
ncbi:ABC transporter permease [Candidatus Peregrinibacteria bacterium]|nr:ABC transporter permease [Candidatus Peregrinibacteria bacterium]MBT4056165.1 ABC transporter permease [Candidatus Peregrinibacteria bacterium]